MYHIPNSLQIQKDIPLDPISLHRINLFWIQKTIQDRIHTLLHINKSVFIEDCTYIDEILLLATEASYKPHCSSKLAHAPKEYMKDQLPNHMLKKQPTIHHILFQNNELWWHPSERTNLITMEHWIHNSFHQLLDHENLYPHKHISKIFGYEKDLFTQWWRENLLEIEQSIDEIFREDPFSIYKQECFNHKFRRKIA